VPHAIAESGAFCPTEGHGAAAAVPGRLEPCGCLLDGRRFARCPLDKTVLCPRRMPPGPGCLGACRLLRGRVRAYMCFFLLRAGVADHCRDAAQEHVDLKRCLQELAKEAVNEVLSRSKSGRWVGLAGRF